MRTMRCAIGFAAVLLASPVHRTVEPEPDAVDRLMADAMKAWDVPGAALVVVRGPDVLVLKGYGRKHIGKPDPITPDTVFPLASCSKAFTSTLLAMLVDDRRLGWDDPVRDDLPGFKLSDPNADAMVTLRDLLAHRTGVSGNDLLWYHSLFTVDEVVRKIGQLPLSYPFRGGFDYSSIMYMAAGRAAAHRAGKPWEMLVKERITDPLGMTGVRFTTKDIPANADRATGHRRTKSAAIEPMPAYEMSEPNPAGSVHATARDLAAWVKFHLAGGVVNGRRLVSEKSLNETRMPQAIIRLEGNAKAMNPDTVQLSYGMGWVVSDHRGKRVLAHGGMIDGFRVQITLLPDENLGFAVLNNLHETRMNQAVTNSLIDRYCDLPVRDWNAFFLKLVADTAAAKEAALTARGRSRNPNTRPTLALEGYTGDYEHPVYGPAKVTAEGGKLVLAWSGFRCPLDHFQDNTFRVTEGYFENQLVEFAVTPARIAGALQLGNFVFRRK